jgi:hypothetical protein
MQFPHPDHALPGIPGFFRACCRDVKLRRVHAGYDHPGHELARHLDELCPHGLDEDEWARRLGRLAALVWERNDAKVLGWFKEHFPRCLAEIPRRRQAQFLAGVYRAAEDGSAGFPLYQAEEG